MSERPKHWVKLWVSWLTSPAHLELSGGALDGAVQAAEAIVHAHDRANDVAFKRLVAALRLARDNIPRPAAPGGPTT